MPIILVSVRVLMCFTCPRARKFEIIPRICRFCFTSPICSLKRAGLKKLRDIFSIWRIVVGPGTVRGTFMQSGLWTGGMIISFNPLETQFSIIIRYAPCLVYEVLLLTAFQSNSIYSLNQRYTEPSDVEEYMRINHLF